MLKPSAAAIVELQRIVEVPKPSLTDRIWGRAGTLATVTPVPAEPQVLEQALAALSRIGDWQVLPYLTWLLDYEHTRRAVLDAIQALMPEDCEALVRLDEGMRETTYGWPIWWPQSKPFPWPRRFDDDKALRILHSTAGNVLPAGFLSFSPSGYVREAALRNLAKSEDGREVPFLLLRVNDSVEPVSRYALRTCYGRLRAGYETHFANSLTLVARLRHQRRWDHAGFIDLVDQLLSETADGRRAVLEHFDQGGVLLRRARADLIARRFPGGMPLPERMFALFDDRDPIVRSHLVAAVARLGSEPDLRTWIPRMTEEPSAEIRRRAFAVAEARMPALADELALRLLFDRNAWLREFARQRLQKRGIADFADRYRNAIRSGIELEGSLLGLMETGTRTDAPLAAPLVDTGSSRVGRAALLAASSLDSEKAGDLLIRALTSSRRGLSLAAAVGIVNCRAFVPVEEFDRLLGAGEPHVRRNVLRVLSTRDRWMALVGALRLRSDRDDHVAHAARVVLEKWRRPPVALYVQPSSGQRSEIIRMMTDLDDFPEVRNTLEQLLHD
jgi:HEAT repeat protein